jgi:hypothetical protein
LEGSNLAGGDFNLVRIQEEKSNGVANFAHARLFNDWIEKWGVIPVKYLLGLTTKIIQSWPKLIEFLSLLIGIINIPWPR